jgi:rhodanese-related sulfurtransferase
MATTLKSLQEDAEKAVTKIDFVDAKRLLDEGRAVAVDIREEEEFRTLETLPGAISIPRSRLEFKCDPASPFYETALNTEKTILVYCNTGGRALLAAKTMLDMGVENTRLLGGIQGWIASGGDVEG